MPTSMRCRSVSIKTGIERDDLIDQLDHAGAAAILRRAVGGLLERGQRVGNRNTVADGAQECVVVLGIADAHDVVRRKPQLVERRGKARRLVHTGSAGSSRRPC